jgi:SET domain-containing protein
MALKRKAFLKHIESHVYCKLGCSTVDGVGVFALRDIPSNTDPFVVLSRHHERFDLTEAELRDAGVASPVIAHLKSFLSTNERAQFPVTDLNALDVSFYINHAKKPKANMTFRSCADIGCKRRCAFEHLVSTKAIAAGDELFYDFEEEFSELERGPADFLKSSTKTNDGGEQKRRRK